MVLGVLSGFCKHLTEEEIAGCFILIVFLLSCDCQCSVSLIRSSMGWFVIVAFPGQTFFFSVNSFEISLKYFILKILYVI